MVSSGYARVVLLVLVTTVFAAVWSNDRRPQIPRRTVSAYDLAAPGPIERIEAEFTAPSASALLQVVVEPWETAPAYCRAFRPEAIAATKMQQSDDSRSFRLPAYSIPIPGDIVPGAYRVVDGRGNVSTLTVTESDLSGRPLSEPRDHLVVHSDDNRWHFILIDADAATQPAINDQSVVSRADVVDAWQHVARSAWGRLERPLETISGPFKRWLRRDNAIGAAQRELN